jgi:glycoprotein-N-acetylgalactosamine 3-beta-galactosyltransferase
MSQLYRDYKSSDPVYFGHHFKTIVKQGYYSGGAGYVLSKEALTRFANKGRNSKICRQDGGYEDVELGICMENLGDKPISIVFIMFVHISKRLHSFPS